MGNADFVYPSTNDHQCAHRVAIPPPQPFFKTFKNSLKETFFPDDPLKQFKNKTPSRKFILGLQYFLPILEWAPRYSLQFLKADLISGITIASLAIPQGISYAKLANLPPILGLYSSFIPPLVYAMMGSSRDLAVGTVAVASLLTASMLGQEVSASENPTLYLHLAFTATFFAGLLQASLGLLRYSNSLVDRFMHVFILCLSFPYSGYVRFADFEKRLKITLKEDVIWVKNKNHNRVLKLTKKGITEHVVVCLIPAGILVLYSCLAGCA